MVNNFFENVDGQILFLMFKLVKQSFDN